MAVTARVGAHSEHGSTDAAVETLDGWYYSENC
jgi:hypothetical protein